MKPVRTSLVVTAAAATALAAATPVQAKKPITLQVGNQPWHLVLPSGELKPIEGAPSSPDRQIFTYRSGQMVLSVIVENAHEPATMASCRSVFAQRKQQGTGGMRVSNEVQSLRGEAATQEFDLKLGAIDPKLAAVVEHDIYSCRVRGTYYIDVHASKLPYQPGDHAALMALADGVAIVN